MDTDVLDMVVTQTGEYTGINPVSCERFGVLAQAQPVKPSAPSHIVAPATSCQRLAKCDVAFYRLGAVEIRSLLEGAEAPGRG